MPVSMAAWPDPSSPSVTVISVSFVVRATVTRRPSRGPMVSSPSGVVMAASPWRSRVAAWMSRSFSGAAADREPEEGGQRVPGRERARHEAAAQEPLGDGRRPLRRAEVDEQEVRDRRADRPAGRAQAGGEALALDARRARGWPRGCVSSRRASVTTVTETVETEPGGRYGFSRAMTRGIGDREPDPQAGERVGLAGRADDDEVRVAGPQAEERPPDELGVGLVEDDDRAPGGRRGRRPRRGPSSRRCDGAVGLRERRRVVRAAQPDDRGAERAAARTASRSSAQPASRPSRGTATTSAPRCSVRTRYIAYVGVGTTAATARPAGTPWR